MYIVSCIYIIQITKDLYIILKNPSSCETLLNQLLGLWISKLVNFDGLLLDSSRNFLLESSKSPFFLLDQLCKGSICTNYHANFDTILIVINSLTNFVYLMTNDPAISNWKVMYVSNSIMILQLLCEEM